MLKEKKERMLVNVANFLVSFAAVTVYSIYACVVFIGEPKLPDKYLKDED